LGEPAVGKGIQNNQSTAVGEKREESARERFKSVEVEKVMSMEVTPEEREARMSRKYLVADVVGSLRKGRRDPTNLSRREIRDRRPPRKNGEEL